MPPLPDISVVIPTFERPDLLEQCLWSLQGQTTPSERFEVVVIDDGSSAATDDIIAKSTKAMPNLITAKQPTNRGPAAARNRGVNMASAELILFLDDDMVAAPDLIAGHVGCHAGRDGHLGVVGLVEWLPQLDISPFMRWLDAGDVQFNYSRLNPGPVDHPWDAFYTCNVSLRRELFQASGGFDERFPYPAYEDTELAARLSEFGFHLEYRPNLLAWHARPITLDIFCDRMRKVGQAAVLLNRIRPNFPNLPRTDLPAYGVLRRILVRSLGWVAATSTRDGVRGKYYQHRVNIAYRSGLAAGRARLLESESMSHSSRKAID
jgi:GT2 family glycosyltransferase